VTGHGVGRDESTADGLFDGRTASSTVSSMSSVPLNVIVRKRVERDVDHPGRGSHAIDEGERRRFVQRIDDRRLD
jgi:hypothetical protein